MNEMYEEKIRAIADEIERIRSLDLGHSLFFSHQDPQTVEMIINLSR